MLPFCVEPNADADFWAASKEVTFESQTVRVLDPADQLLHICAHGAAWDIIAPVRWIPDAVAVLQGAPRINWERLLLQTRRRKVTLLVRGALNYINQTLGALVPADVLREINRLDVSIFEKSNSSIKDMAAVTLERERRTVQEIEGALKRIKSGEYGLCASCDKPIPDARLKALPCARVCVRCAEQGSGSRSNGLTAD
jgi:hypothetical protein